MLRRVFFAAALLAAPALAQSPTDADPAARAARPAAPAAFGPSDVAWGYDARYADAADRLFVSFRLDAGLVPADGPALLAPDGALIQGCDFDDDDDFSQMLCISSAGQLFRTDLEADTTETIGSGDYGGAVADLTYSAGHDAWYALASDCSGEPEGYRSALFRVDPATGAASAVGSGTEVSFCGLGLAAAPDSTLYAYSAETPAAASRGAQIDPETGAFDLLGETGFDAYYAQAMDCDASDGTCYAFGYQGSGFNGLYEFNTTTGRLGLVGDLPEGAELTAAAIATNTTMAVGAERAPQAAAGLRILSATPARGTLRLGVGAPEAVLTVYDALGRRVERRERASGTFALDVSRWAPGVYVLRLATSSAVTSHRVTVVR